MALDLFSSLIASRKPSGRALRPAASRRPVLPALAALALAALAGGCERVSYYSFTGTAPEDGETTDNPTTSSTSTGSTTEPSAVTRAAVLEGIGVCAAKLYEEVAATTATFADRAAKAAKSSDPAALTAAREAWSAAMDAWQQAEVIRVGPAGPATDPGGEGLRDYVYSWPLVSRCLVEQKLAAKSYESSDFLAGALVNMRGLGAAEYLLFHEGTDNACSGSASINTSGAWAALSASELGARKRAYASVAAGDVAAQGKALALGWSKGGGDLVGQLASAGQAGSIFSTDRLAMNLLSDGLFYLDTATKDGKLAKPLGLIDCEAASCPEAVESPYAHRSRAHVKNNLVGLRRVFSGCDEGGGLGFDDLLVGLGQEALAQAMSGHVEEAIAAAEALPSDDIAQVLASDKAKVAALHAAVKKITDDLKSDFVTVLDLELPQNVEGDND